MDSNKRQDDHVSRNDISYQINSRYVNTEAHDTCNSIEIGLASNQNMAFRETQEDAAGMAQIKLLHPIDGYMDITVLSVFDGVGGRNGGEYASGTACQLILQNIISGCMTMTDPEQQLPEIIEFALANANRNIRAFPLFISGAATTAAISVIVESQWYGRLCVTSHVGDSRVYVITNNKQAVLFTRDHSRVEELVASGEITSEEAQTHPESHVITAAIGASSILPELDISIKNIDDVIAIIALTDGVWGPLVRSLGSEFPQYLTNTICQHSSQEAAELLVAEAIHSGGEDNATAAIAIVSGDINRSKTQIDYPELNNHTKEGNK